MRGKKIVANWKMHKNAEQTEDLLNELIENTFETEVQKIIVYSTFINLATANHLEFVGIDFAAQNMHQAIGAFTEKYLLICYNWCEYCNSWRRRAI
jgi:triosephosphate isomerase